MNKGGVRLEKCRDAPAEREEQRGRKQEPWHKPHERPLRSVQQDVGSNNATDNAGDDERGESLLMAATGAAISSSGGERPRPERGGVGGVGGDRGHAGEDERGEGNKASAA